MPGYAAVPGVFPRDNLNGLPTDTEATEITFMLSTTCLFVVACAYAALGGYMQSLFGARAWLCLLGTAVALIVAGVGLQLFHSPARKRLASYIVCGGTVVLGGVLGGVVVLSVVSR
jgi:phosphotransferase system  glucose/maltose/N-acetylglucosamine-specific IIC component